MAPTQTDYIILAYLADGPEHGYRLIERMKMDNLHLIADFSVPTIYHALRRLHRSGAVGLETKKSANRPDQKIYSLTERGKEILDEIAADKGLFDQQNRFRSDILIFLSDKLGLKSKDLSGPVEQRIERLNDDLRRMQEALSASQTADGGISRLGEIAFRHQIRFLKGEIDFYRKLLKELK